MCKKSIDSNGSRERRSISVGRVTGWFPRAPPVLWSHSGRHNLNNDLAFRHSAPLGTVAQHQTTVSSRPDDSSKRALRRERGRAFVSGRRRFAAGSVSSRQDQPTR